MQRKKRDGESPPVFWLLLSASTREALKSISYYRLCPRKKRGFFYLFALLSSWQVGRIASRSRLLFREKGSKVLILFSCERGRSPLRQRPAAARRRWTAQSLSARLQGRNSICGFHFRDRGEDTIFSPGIISGVPRRVPGANPAISPLRNIVVRRHQAFGQAALRNAANP